jgi:uncharacterized protein (DUF2062 family)
MIKQSSNTFKATIAGSLQGFAGLVYLKPLRFIMGIFSKKTLTGVIDELRNPNQSDELKAFSAALGIFVGIVPVWGLQTLLAIFFAWVFKLNKAIVVIFSQVSFPPFMPLIIFLSYKAGKYWIENGITRDSFNRRFEQYIYGSLTLAMGGAVVTGIVTLAILKSIKIFKHYRLLAAERNLSKGAL